jgi:hypothetical protein
VIVEDKDESRRTASHRHITAEESFAQQGYTTVLAAGDVLYRTRAARRGDTGLELRDVRKDNEKTQTRRRHRTRIEYGFFDTEIPFEGGCVRWILATVTAPNSFFSPLGPPEPPVIEH